MEEILDSIMSNSGFLESLRRFLSSPLRNGAPAAGWMSVVTTHVADHSAECSLRHTPPYAGIYGRDIMPNMYTKCIRVDYRGGLTVDMFTIEVKSLIIYYYLLYLQKSVPPLDYRGGLTIDMFTIEVTSL